MKYCVKCGSPLKSGAKYCTHCGNEVPVVEENPSEKESAKDSTLDFTAINNRIGLQNSQTKVARISSYLAVFFFVLMLLPFQEWSPVAGFWAVAMISLFLFISAVIVGFLFRSRGKKLQTLINGKNLLAHWRLTSSEKDNYVKALYTNELRKNKGILLVIVLLATVVFGLFIYLVEEDRLPMLFVYFGLIGLVSIFALGMPSYYRYQNKKNDGLVLLGAKYAYINGYFHNWDFPLSGIKKARIIHTPFYGLLIQYYYTDRTFRNTEELVIPAPKDIDLKQVVAQIKK